MLVIKLLLYSTVPVKKENKAVPDKGQHFNPKTLEAENLVHCTVVQSIVLKLRSSGFARKKCWMVLQLFTFHIRAKNVT